MTALKQPKSGNFGTCGCGNPAEKFQSGRPTCWKCWSVWKLDYPAAKYWVEKITGLFEQGPDVYDFQMWAQWGMSEEMSKALHTILAMRHAYQEMMDNPTPWETEERKAQRNEQASS